MQSKRAEKLQRVAVVREPQEQKIHDVVKMVKAMHREKKRMSRHQVIAKALEHKKKVKKIQDNRDEKQKVLRKKIFKGMSQSKGKSKS
jgi:hypothetical protein